MQQVCVSMLAYIWVMHTQSCVELWLYPTANVSLSSIILCVSWAVVNMQHCQYITVWYRLQQRISPPVIDPTHRVDSHVWEATVPCSWGCWKPLLPIDCFQYCLLSLRGGNNCRGWNCYMWVHGVWGLIKSCGLLYSMSTLYRWLAAACCRTLQFVHASHIHYTVFY